MTDFMNKSRRGKDWLTKKLQKWPLIALSISISNAPSRLNKSVLSVSVLSTREPSENELLVSRLSWSESSVSALSAKRSRNSWRGKWRSCSRESRRVEKKKKRPPLHQVS